MRAELAPGTAALLVKVCRALHLDSHRADVVDYAVRETLDFVWSRSRGLDERGESAMFLVERVRFISEAEARSAAAAALWMATRGGSRLEWVDIKPRLEVQWLGGSAVVDAMDIAWENVQPPRVPGARGAHPTSRGKGGSE